MPGDEIRAALEIRPVNRWLLFEMGRFGFQCEELRGILRTDLYRF